MTKTNKLLLIILTSIALSSCTIISHREFTEMDYRNTNVPIVVTGIPFTGEITINMKKTNNYDFSATDMYRCYLQAAEKLKDNNYNKVYLANKGEKIFIISGEYFKELGYAYANGNALDFELPSHLYNMDGAPAYNTWSGGWLGVMSKQIEDFSDMMERLCP